MSQGRRCCSVDGMTRWYRAAAMLVGIVFAGLGLAGMIYDLTEETSSSAEWVVIAALIVVGGALIAGRPRLR